MLLIYWQINLFNPWNIDFTQSFHKLFRNVILSLSTNISTNFGLLHPPLHHWQWLAWRFQRRWRNWGLLGLFLQALYSVTEILLFCNLKQYVLKLLWCNHWRQGRSIFIIWIRWACSCSLQGNIARLYSHLPSKVIFTIWGMGGRQGYFIVKKTSLERRTMLPQRNDNWGWLLIPNCNKSLSGDC